MPEYTPLAVASGRSRKAKARTSFAQQGITQADLRVLAARLAQTNPESKSLLSSIATPFKSVGKGILGILDLPRKAVFEGIVNPLVPGDIRSGADLAKKWGLKGFSKAAVGFGLDVGLDPLTYLTGGSSAVGRVAARRAILELGTKRILSKELGGEAVEALAKAGRAEGKGLVDAAASQAGKNPKEFVLNHPELRAWHEKVVGQEMATRFNPKTRKFDQAVDEAGAPLRRQRRLSEVMRDLGPEEVSALPAHLQGGIRLRLPFGKALTGARREAALIPASATTKLSAPVGKALLGGKLGSQTLPRLFSPGQRALAAGVDGHFEEMAREAQRNHDAVLRQEGLGVLDFTQKALKSDADKAAFANALFRNDWSGVVQGSEVEEALLAWKGADGLFARRLDEAQKAGIPVEGVTSLPDGRSSYGPRVFTEEATRAKKGARLEQAVAWSAPKTRSWAKNRKLHDVDFDEAQDIVSRDLGVKAFEDDPIAALAKWVGATSADISGNKFAKELADMNIIKSSSLSGLTEDGVRILKSDLNRAGFRGPKAVADARRAVLSGAPEAANLSPETRAALDSIINFDKKRTLAKSILVPSMGAGRAVKVDARVPVEEAVQMDLQGSLRRLDILESAGAKRELGLRDAQRRVAEVEESIADARAQLDSINAEKELFDLQFLAGAPKRPGKVEKARRAGLRDFDQKIRAKQAYIKHLERKVNPRVKGSKVQVVAKREAEVAKNRADVEEQLSRVGERRQRIENVLEGKSPSGKEWPVPKFNRNQAPKDPLTGEEWVQIQGTSIGAINGNWAPKEIANELLNTLKPRGTGVMLGEYDKFLGWFRQWATVPFPAFHARNLFGGWFNNFLGGVNIQDYKIARAVREATRRAEEAAEAAGMPKGSILWDGLPDESWDELGGLTSQDIAKIWRGDRLFKVDASSSLAEMAGVTGREGGFGLPGLKPLSEGWIRAGRWGSSKVETHLRDAAFVGGLRQTGGSVDASRSFTAVRHGDYQDLTAFERDFLRRVIPFYKWTRMNIPLQLQQLTTDPARTLGVVRFQDQVLGDPEVTDKLKKSGVFPKWVENQGGTAAAPFLQKLLGGTADEPATVGLNLPFFDINRMLPEGLSVKSGLRGILSSTVPVVKGPIEQATGVNIFRGEKFRDFETPRGATKALAEMLDRTMPGKFTMRGKGGELLIKGNISNAISAVPTSRVAESLPEIISPVSGRPTARLRNLVGIDFGQVTEGSQQAALGDQKEQYEELLKTLYRLGYGEDFRATKPERRKKARTKNYYRYSN